MTFEKCDFHAMLLFVYKTVWLLIIDLLLISVPGGYAEKLPLPLPSPKEEWRKLYEWADPSFEEVLARQLKDNASWRSLIKNKRMAVGIVDLSNPEKPRFASVNGSTMMYAASLPKIAILLAAYVLFEEGSLKETKEIHDDLIAMIRESSNKAATRMINLIGLDNIAKIVTDPRYELFDENRGGGLWVGKAYAKGGKAHRDPIAGLTHAATVMQVCRFYYMLAYGKIINPARSSEMLHILAKPKISHKFVKVLKKKAPRASLYRKSGTWKQWHSDSVMVWGDVWRRYILVSMVESTRGEKILGDLVSVVEDILHPEKLL